MNYIAEFLDEDLEVAASIVNRNRTIVYAVEDLTPSLQPALPQRRNPDRNENYVEDTIPLYSPDEFRNHFRMSRDTFDLLSSYYSNYTLNKIHILLQCYL
nr:unnamed protein product [Callosobruchus analis]